MKTDALQVPWSSILNIRFVCNHHHSFSLRTQAQIEALERLGAQTMLKVMFCKELPCPLKTIGVTVYGHGFPTHGRLLCFCKNVQTSRAQCTHGMKIDNFRQRFASLEVI